MKNNRWCWPIILFSMIFLTAAIISCKEEDEIPDGLGQFLVSYSKGSAWVEYYYEAKIDQSGYMDVREENGINGQNRFAAYKISKDELGAIHEKLADLTQIDIANSYGFENEAAPTDLPTTILKYDAGAKSDSTSIYFPQDHEMPNELESLIQLVEQVILNYDSPADR